MYPETVDVLAAQLNDTAWLIASPVPERTSVFGDPVALLVTVTEPLSAPASDGANTASNVMLWFATKVTGVPALAREKPVPLSLI